MQIVSHVALAGFLASLLLAPLAGCSSSSSPPPVIPRTSMPVLPEIARLAADSNTLICCGNADWFFEVDSTGVIQWQYQNTVGQGPQGAPVFRCLRYSPD